MRRDPELRTAIALLLLAIAAAFAPTVIRDHTDSPTTCNTHTEQENHPCPSAT